MEHFYIMSSPDMTSFMFILCLLLPCPSNSAHWNLVLLVNRDQQPALCSKQLSVFPKCTHKLSHYHFHWLHGESKQSLCRGLRNDHFSGLSSLSIAWEACKRGCFHYVAVQISILFSIKLKEKQKYPPVRITRSRSLNLCGQ